MSRMTALTSVPSLFWISLSFRYPHIISRLAAFCGLSFFLVIIKPPDCVVLSYISLKVYTNFRIAPCNTLFLTKLHIPKPVEVQRTAETHSAYNTHPLYLEIFKQSSCIYGNLFSCSYILLEV